MKELTLSGVSVDYGPVKALSSVDVTARAGEVLLLVGPNGAGKSTLMKVLLGLIRPQAGRLRVDGTERAIDNAFKRSLGYLPEAVAFSENLTGRQVLRFFAAARGVPRRAVDAVLARVGLEHAARRAVRGYSRGMRQRLGIGVAILADPELLILDEPTGGLDQEGLRLLWDVLDDSRRRARTVIVASHELAMLERRVDAVCVLRAGRVLATDAPSALRLRSGLPSRVHFELAATADGAGAAFAEALRRWGRAKLDEAAGGITAEVAPGDLLDMLDLRAAAPGAVVGVRIAEPTLDVVYEHLLGVR